MILKKCPPRTLIFYDIVPYYSKNAKLLAILRFSKFIKGEKGRTKMGFLLFWGFVCGDLKIRV